MDTYPNSGDVLFRDFAQREKEADNELVLIDRAADY